MICIVCARYINALNLLIEQPNNKQRSETKPTIWLAYSRRSMIKTFKHLRYVKYMLHVTVKSIFFYNLFYISKILQGK